MKFFHFNQNNSFGQYDGPALDVVIEAENAKDANHRAEDNGLYFDGCMDGIDCKCCGDRWSRQFSCEEGSSTPCVYGEELVLVDEPTQMLVVFADGSTKFARYKYFSEFLDN
jgi:hypothetical protein